MYLLPQRFCAKLKACYLSFRWARLESKVSEDSFAYMPTQLCLTLCDPITPGSSAHGNSQARILERVVISFSMGFF